MLTSVVQFFALQSHTMREHSFRIETQQALRGVLKVVDVAEFPDVRVLVAHPMETGQRKDALVQLDVGKHPARQHQPQAQPRQRGPLLAPQHHRDANEHRRDAEHKNQGPDARRKRLAEPEECADILGVLDGNAKVKAVA